MKHFDKSLQRGLPSKQVLPNPAEAGTLEDQSAPALPTLVRTLIQEKKLATAQRVALIQKIGQSYGNRQVERLLVSRATEPQREAEEDFRPSGTLASASSLKLPKSIKLKQSDVAAKRLGDYPAPAESNNVMALHESQPSGTIQREESKPGWSLQVEGTSQESAWTFEIEGSYNNLLVKNLLKKGAFQLDLNLSPKIKFAVERQNTGDTEVSLENGLTLLQAKWLPFWQRQITAEISAYAKYTLVPQLRAEYGARGELNLNLIEKKVKDTTISLDLKLGVSGVWSYNEETKKSGIMLPIDAGLKLEASF